MASVATLKQLLRTKPYYPELRNDKWNEDNRDGEEERIAYLNQLLIQVASNRVTRDGLSKGRLNSTANLHRIRAAGAKTAAWGRIERAR